MFILIGWVTANLSMLWNDDTEHDLTMLDSNLLLLFVDVFVLFMFVIFMPLLVSLSLFVADYFPFTIEVITIEGFFFFYYDVKLWSCDCFYTDCLWIPVISDCLCSDNTWLGLDKLEAVFVRVELCCCTLYKELDLDSAFFLLFIL